MYPRLQPRPSPGIEKALSVEFNIVPIKDPEPIVNDDDKQKSTSNSSKDFHGVSLLETKQACKDPTGSDPVLGKAPLSPTSSNVEKSIFADATQNDVSETPVPKQGQHHKHILNYSMSSSESDFTLTPPAAQSRPLVVAAKRHSSEVRRQHSKRRRRRRRSSTQKSSGFPSVLVTLTSKLDRHRGSDDCEDDEDSWFLWKQEKELPEADDSLSDEEEDYENFPFPTGKDQMCQNEINKHYWEWCYGNGQTLNLPLACGSVSAKRVPPSKSCFSNSWQERKLNCQYNTPPGSPAKMVDETKCKKDHRVQFGSPSAVEYHSELPTQQLTPMPQEVIRKRFSMDQKIGTQEEEEMTMETKQNNAILSEWDDRFFREKPKGRNRCGGGSSGKRNRRNRRTSSMFSPSSKLFQFPGDEDGTEDTNLSTKNERPSTERTELEEAQSGSPSVLISQNMAALNMSSVSSNHKEHVENGMMENSAVSHSFYEDQGTWEYVVDLASINSTGAACTSIYDSMEVSSIPPQMLTNSSSNYDRSFRCSSGRSASPPSDVDFDGINSFGAALEENCHLRNQNEDLSVSQSHFHVNKEFINRDDYNIAKMLIETPWLDQEFDLPNVLRNLSLLEYQPQSILSNFLHLVEPCNKVTDCIDKLLNTTRSWSVSANNEVPIDEWQRLECDFMLELTNLLNDCVHEISAMLKVRRFFTGGVSSENISEQIAFLEKEIQQERQFLDLLDAACAPQTVMQCQISGWINLSGFCLESFDEEEIILNWEHHPVVETRVILNQFSSWKTRIEPRHALSKEGENKRIKAYKAGVDFFINFVAESLPSLEMDTLFQNVSRALANLDMAVEALMKIYSDKDTAVAVSLQLPNIILSSLVTDRIAHLTLDPETFSLRQVMLSNKSLARNRQESGCTDWSTLHDLLCPYMRHSSG